MLKSVNAEVLKDEFKEEKGLKKNKNRSFTKSLSF